MDSRDLRAVTRLHRRHLRRGLFGRLGASFLAAYLDSFRTSPEGRALVATRGGVPVGFLVGTVRHVEHREWTIRHRGIGLALRGLVGLALRPRLLAWFLRTRTGRYARRLWQATRPATDDVDGASGSGPGSPGVDGARAVGVLAHVAVDPAARGLGAGRDLVDTFVALAHAAGTRDVRLTTAADDGADSFYRRLGWRCSDTRTDHDGTVVHEFHSPIPGSS